VSLFALKKECGLKVTKIKNRSNCFSYTLFKWKVWDTWWRWTAWF